MGVSHKYGEELIKQGVKFTKKIITDKLFPSKNKYYDINSLNVPEESSLIQDVVLEAVSYTHLTLPTIE